MPTPSRGVELLDDLLKSDCPEAAAVRAALHRSQICNYRAMRRAPSVQTAFAIQSASKGKIPAASWTERARRQATHEKAERERAKRSPAPVEAAS